MINVLVCGIGGKMGENIVALLNGDTGAQVVCGVDLHKPENPHLTGLKKKLT